MKYIAKKLEGTEFEIKGIKEYETLTGEKVEVVFDTVVRDKVKLEEALSAYKTEKEQVCERYDADIKEMEEIITSMNEAK